MQNDYNKNDDGLYDLINVDDDSNDSVETSRTEALIYDSTPIDWKTINIEPSNQSNVRTRIIPKREINNHNIESVIICSKCNVELLSPSPCCLSCGEFLIKSKIINQNNNNQDKPVLNENGGYYLDLSEINSHRQDEPNNHIMDLDIDLDDNNEINFNQNQPKHNMYIPPLDLSNINSDRSVLIPNHSSHSDPVEEKENVRRWATSSLAWKDMPVEILQKKPANFRRDKLNSCTNHLGIDVYPVDSNLEEIVETKIVHNPILSNQIIDQPKPLLISTPSPPPLYHNYQWGCLPTEIWLIIMSYLPLSSLSSLQLTNKRLYCIGRYPGVLRCVTLNKNQCLTDDVLLNIAARQPKELHFINCFGTNLTKNGISEMLSTCGDKLTKLSFISCSKGALNTDDFLLLSTQFCRQITQINASYLMKLQDETLIAMSTGYNSLTSLSLMGSGNITNYGIKAIIKRHCSTIKHIDLYGCFRINNETLNILESCINLESLALGSITRLGRNNLINLLEKLENLRNLDLRGTLNLVDDTLLEKICELCPNLRNIVLTNSARLTTQGLIYLSESGVAKTLELLDVCGCSHVKDAGVQKILMKCKSLEDLDISCTGITSRLVKTFQKASPPSLKILRINNNKIFTQSELSTIVRCCNQLTTIYLCGTSSIDCWNTLKQKFPWINFKHD